MVFSNCTNFCDSESRERRDKDANDYMNVIIHKHKQQYEHEQTLYYMEREVSVRENAIVQTASRLEDQEKYVSSRHTELAARDTILQAREHRLEAGESHVKDREMTAVSVLLREYQVKQNEGILKRKEARLSWRERVLQAREVRLNKQERANAKNEQTVTTQNISNNIIFANIAGGHASRYTSLDSEVNVSSALSTHPLIQRAPALILPSIPVSRPGMAVSDLN